MTTNPWGLTPHASDALQALIDHETPQAAATHLGVSLAAFNDSIRRARKRMGVERTQTAVLQWDRHMRGETKPQQQADHWIWSRLVN